MKLPGMRGLFVKLWDPMTRKMFGPENGFRNVFYPRKKGEYRMDVLACPYCRYFTELGCPELTRIFCENDDRIYVSGDVNLILCDGATLIAKKFFSGNFARMKDPEKHPNVLKRK